MNKWLKRSIWTVGILIAVLVVAFFALRTPDTDRDAMIAKYGGPQSRFVTLADGARVHVRDTGGSGMSMILIHGSNASLHTWEPLKAELGSGYRIVTMDMPGHGLTGATPSGRYDIDEMVATVDGVAGALGIERFILGGNSMGGGVSWRYALAHPDKVQALLLLDAGGMPPRSGDVPPKSNIGFRIMRSSFGRWLGGKITPRFLIRQSLEQSVANPSRITEADVDRYWELLRFPGNRAATMMRFSRPFVDDGAAERARGISVPTLILFGQQDRIINPSAALSFGERIAGSEVLLLEGIGHLPMEEAPSATAAAIREFLGRRLHVNPSLGREGQ